MRSSVKATTCMVHDNSIEIGHVEGERVIKSILDLSIGLPTVKSVWLRWGQLLVNSKITVCC